MHSVPVPCQGLSLAYATNLDYASLKYGRSLHKMLSHLQTTGSSHANISTPLKCTITMSQTDCCALLHLHASSYHALAQARSKQCLHSCSVLIIIAIISDSYC